MGLSSVVGRELPPDVSETYDRSFLLETKMCCCQSEDRSAIPQEMREGKGGELTEDYPVLHTRCMRHQTVASRQR
jgi:hypothetical protein